MSWLYLRLSGLLLAALVAAHLMHSVFGLMHPSTDVSRMVVKAGLISLVLLATSHGLVGVANVIRDQGLARDGRVGLGWTLVAVGTLLSLGALRVLHDVFRTL